MINKIYSTISLLLLLFAAGCSESLEDTYDAFSGDGMNRYVGKCSEVEVNSGWERLQVVWKHNIDAGVKNVKISWKSDAGNGEMLVPPCDPESDNLMDTAYIEGLKDAMYTVRVNNVSADGRESLVEEKYGRPYSYDHEALRSFSRGISAFSRMGDKLAVLLAQDNEDIKEMKLSFTGKDGQVHDWDIKAHANDMLWYMGMLETDIRDYFFLLPDADMEEEGVEIDFSKDIVVKREGILTGCIDTIKFRDERLDLGERLWSAAFSQLMLGAYGPDWESRVDEVETLEIDFDIPSMQDLMYFPNLKKVILGKNRYMKAKYASSYHSTTDEYLGLVMLQFLHDTRPEFTVERYNEHYFFEFSDDWYSNNFDLLQACSKLSMDWTIEEKYAGNLNAKPNFVPLDATDWVVTCSDTMYNGEKKNGAGYLLKENEEGKPETYFEPGQSLGASVITVTYDMKEEKKVAGFKVVQPSREESEDLDYLLPNLKVEFSADSYNWEEATYTDGSVSIGKTPGEETYVHVPVEKQIPARYIRLTMSSLPIGQIDSRTTYGLRLGKFIPCSVEQ